MIRSAAVLLAAAMAVMQEDPPDLYSNSYDGKCPPELISKPEHWMNAPKDGLTLAGLKGRMVWLEFTFLTG